VGRREPFGPEAESEAIEEGGQVCGGMLIACANERKEGHRAESTVILVGALVEQV
jgi:hypothetical protein